MVRFLGRRFPCFGTMGAKGDIHVAAKQLHRGIRLRNVETTQAVVDWMEAVCGDTTESESESESEGPAASHALRAEDVEEEDEEPSPAKTWTSRLASVYRPPPFPLDIPRTRENIEPPSIAIFCDDTSQHFSQPEPTNIPVLYSILRQRFPDTMTEDRCLYFRGAGKPCLDFLSWNSAVDKLKEIYWATCRALLTVEDGESEGDTSSLPPLVLDVFGFGTGALLARSAVFIFLRFGAALPFADQRGDAFTEEKFRARCDLVVDTFLRYDAIDKASKFARSAEWVTRRRCDVRFLGLFDTVPGMSISRAIGLGAAALPKRFFLRGDGGADGADRSAPGTDEGEFDGGRILSSLHLQAEMHVATFPTLSLYSVDRNFSLGSSAAPETTETETKHQRTWRPGVHDELRVPGDHFHIGGGRTSLEKRLTNVYKANGTLQAMLAFSPYYLVVNALGWVNMFPHPPSRDYFIIHCMHERDALGAWIAAGSEPRPKIPRAQALQLIARNILELRDLPLRDPPLDPNHLKHTKKSLKDNIRLLKSISV